MAINSFLTTLTILTFLAIGASSLKCFICNSVTDKKCWHGDDNVDKKYLKECNTTEEAFKIQLPALPPSHSEYTLCRKMVTYIDFNVNDNQAGQRIKRSCGWDDEETKYINACYYRGGLGGRINVCSCQKDDCNGSSTLGGSFTLALVTVIIGLKILWR